MWDGHFPTHSTGALWRDRRWLRHTPWPRGTGFASFVVEFGGFGGCPKPELLRQWREEMGEEGSNAYSHDKPTRVQVELFVCAERYMF